MRARIYGGIATTSAFYNPRPPCCFPSKGGGLKHYCVPRGSWASPQPQGRIKIMEGCETQPHRIEVVDSKGKGKAGTYSGPSPTSEKPTSLISIEAPLFDLLLFEELPLKGPNKEVVCSLGDVYSGEAIKGVRELLKDATPFKMTAPISVSFFVPYIFGWCPFVTDLLCRSCR